MSIKELDKLNLIKLAFGGYVKPYLSIIQCLGSNIITNVCIRVLGKLNLVQLAFGG